MLEVVLAIGAFAGALLMGAALLAATGSRKRWRAYATPDQAALVSSHEMPPAFTPLQMEPFTLKWPSETERAARQIAELPWPSETWDDEYFGRAAGDVRQIERTARAIDAQRETKTQEANRRRQAADASSEVARHAAEERDKEARQARVEADESRRERRQKQRERQLNPPAEAPPSTAEQEFFVAFDEGGDTRPEITPEQVASLVKEHGLAGAVEHIRAQTGWDFRTAAQHLAETLRNN